MKTTRLIPSLALLALLSACSKKDSAEHYADAQSFLAKQQYNAAIIELRSAVRQSPEDASFRLALGKALLATGDIVSAERELQRALNYGSTHDDVALPLIRANYLLANHSAVLELLAESTELSPRIKALVDSYRALSELELGDTPAAMMLLEQLAESSENNVNAFATALLALSRQDTDDAVTSLLTINSESELYAESLFLKGKIQLSQEDISGAIDSLSSYLELVPSGNLARLFLAQSYIRNQQLEEAEPHLAALLRQFPNQPMANYLQSIVSFSRSDFENAKSHSENAVRDGLVGVRARIIAAISSINLGLEAQALTHLDSAKDFLYQFPDAQRLYAILQLRTGNTEQAKTTLASLPDDEKSLQLIASTAFELVRQGSPDTASDLISMYQQHNERDVDSLTTLGSIKLGIEGQREAGINDLQKALDLDPNVNQARLLLAMTYLQQKEYDKTFELAESWLTNADTAVAGYSMQAYAKFLQQKFDEAQLLVNKALKLEPLTPFPTLVQAMINAQKGDLDSSLKQLGLMLDKHPHYLAGLEQYYVFAKSNQDTVDATKRIENLFNNNEQAYLARLLLARVAHDQEDFQRVVDLLSDVTESTQGFKPIHYLILIESQQELGRLSIAVQIAKQWFQQQPQNIQAGYTFANTLAANQELEPALEVINKLLTLKPGELRLLIAQVSLLNQLQRQEQALAVINNLPPSTANSPQIQFMKGRLLLILGNYTESQQAFRNSYAEVPSHETAMYIAINLATRSEDSAKVFVNRHIKQHGSESGLDTYYATLLLKTDSGESKKMYQTLLEKEPNNLIALNNYAWLLTEDNKAIEAKTYAERALKLQPNHPDILDTYGKVLLKLEQPQDALKQFEQSLSIRPNHTEVMLNYAEALSKVNQADKARQILSEIKSEDPTVVDRVSRLQQQLR